MLEMIPLDADNVVGIRLEGKVSDQAFNEVVAAMKERLERHQKIRVYAEVSSFGGMPVQTVLKDLTFGFRNWRRFEREAIVTDKAWLQKVAQASDKMLPGVEVKVFPTTEQDAARNWITESGP